MSYVNIKDIPEELVKKALDVIKKAADKGKVKKGMNETTKSIERRVSKLVVIASDVDPPEIVYHLPIICEEKKVPFIFAKKDDLGKAVGLHVSCSALSILDLPKDAEKDLADIIKKLDALKK